MSTDFLALRLFCFNIRQHGRHICILNHMWTAANFIIEGRRLCTVALKPTENLVKLLTVEETDKLNISLHWNLAYCKETSRSQIRKRSSSRNRSEVGGNFRLDHFSWMFPRATENAVAGHMWPAGR